MDATVVRTGGATRGAGQHVVHFYPDDAQLASTVGAFLGAGLDAGGRVLVVATPAHRACFERALAGAGTDLAGVSSQGRYRSLDAAALLDRFLVDQAPDRDRFLDVVGAVVGEMARGGPGLRVYGEMVSLLWAQGLVGSAMALEGLWNELGRRVPFTLCCGYPEHLVEVGSVQGDAVRGKHSHVLPAATGQPARGGRTRHYRPTASAPAAARHFVSEVVLRWGRQDGLEACRLVVTELATNAVRHGGGPFAVTVAPSGAGVVISVSDPCRTLPVLRNSRRVSTGGRGMFLVDALSVRWGARLDGAGKTVWAEVGQPGAGSAPRGAPPLQPVLAPEGHEQADRDADDQQARGQQA